MVDSFGLFAWLRLLSTNVFLSFFLIVRIYRAVCIANRKRNKLMDSLVFNIGYVPTFFFF